jgi:hypothetical protein
MATMYVNILVFSNQLIYVNISMKSDFFLFSAHFTPSTIYSPSQLNYTQQYPYTLPSNYINSNNNNNILDVQSIYNTSLPLNQFSTRFTSTKNISNVSHTPSSTSSLSSFDEPPPVRPRLSLRPQLPPPPPPPPPPSLVPIFSSSIPQFRGPTRPAPKPPVQIKTEQQQASEFYYHKMLINLDKYLS